VQLDEYVDPGSPSSPQPASRIRRKYVRYDEYLFIVTKSSDTGTINMRTKKLHYILDESFSDLRRSYILSTLAIIFILWLRCYMHYIGEYAILKMMSVPVIEFTPTFYDISVVYISWSIGQEIGVILTGNLINTLMFLFMMFICWLCQKYVLCFPKVFCRIIAWYGIATILDFILIAIVDFASQNASPECMKLYTFYESKDGTGIVGIFIIIFIYFAVFLINCLFFYNYLIFIHMNGRLLDTYVRLSGGINSFIVPEDNELSIRYLKWVYQNAKNKKNQILVEKKEIPDRDGKKFLPTIVFYTIEPNLPPKLYRCFVQNIDGSIQEIDPRGVQFKDADEKEIFISVNQGRKNEENIPDIEIIGGDVSKEEEPLFGNSEQKRESSFKMMKKHKLE